MSVGNKSASLFQVMNAVAITRVIFLVQMMDWSSQYAKFH